MKYYLRIFISSLLFSCLFLNVHAELSSKHSKRINKVLKKHLRSSDYSFHEISIPGPICEQLSFRIKPGQLLKLQQEGKADHYIFLDQAKGRHELFTFIVLFTPKLEIDLISVIEYNEVHGYEIASKKWLAKFKGINLQSKPQIKGVDAISGATMSCKSIKDGIGKVLKKMNELKQKGCLD